MWHELPGWLIFGAWASAAALCATFWITLVGWCASGLMLDLKFRELFVPLWCFLSFDEATAGRLDAILASRRKGYQPRHALPPGRDQLDPELKIWLYMRHHPPFF